MIIRHAEEKDLPEILNIYACARAFMKQSGNPHQWGDTNPRPELIEEDIRLRRSYVLLQAETPVGVFACIPGEDPTYGRIDGGRWLNEEPYVTIHRIAGNGRAHGILEAAVAFAFGLSDNVRIDTHRDNRVMQHLLGKNGFTRCGLIYLENGDPRIAYQKCAAGTPSSC